ncbi:MAG: TonB family protein [Tepidiphilus sp.]|jgi:protein TonB|nr:TonB family protein [Tepidiphilus sp.]
MQEDSFGGTARRAGRQWRPVLAAWALALAVHALAFGLLAAGLSSAWPPREPPPFAVTLIGPAQEAPDSAAAGEPGGGEEKLAAPVSEPPADVSPHAPSARPSMPSSIRTTAAPRAVAVKPARMPLPERQVSSLEAMPAIKAVAPAGEEGNPPSQGPSQEAGEGRGAEPAVATGDGAGAGGRGNGASGPSSGRGGEGGGGGAGSKGGAPWSERLRAWLEAHKVYPPKARRLGVEGTVWVRLSCSGGKAVVQLERSSGAPWLDEAALALVREGLAALEGDAAVCTQGGFTVPIGYRLVG